VQPAPIEPWMPMMLFAIVFGLSMDYEVFLLSRVREEWKRTGDSRTSVADGLAATAKVITAAAAIMVFVFGLSMDYEVFLLSRIREEWIRTRDSRTAVADGLASTAKVITAAAAIMVFVFGSFILEDDRVLKLMGTGLAAAILLDATIVRMLLVPATMELLGDRNWWLPHWLDRILPNLDVEGHAEPLPEDEGEVFAPADREPEPTGASAD
jgi:uncharacterized membrane protein YdfJ with MMPL/SSD domain